MKKSEITYGDMISVFRERYPDINYEDYRPTASIHVEGKAGITIWLKNGDIMQYFPNIKAKGCDGCRNEDLDRMAFPCCDCSRGMIDYYVHK